jgi:hypothetical protein
LNSISIVLALVNVFLERFYTIITQANLLKTVDIIKAKALSF